MCGVQLDAIFFCEGFIIVVQFDCFMSNLVFSALMHLLNFCFISQLVVFPMEMSMFKSRLSHFYYLIY